MEGTGRPRGAVANMTVGFYESPGGGTLALGRPRYWLRVAIVAAGVWVLVPLMYYFSTIAAANGNPGGSLGLELGMGTFVILGVFMVAAVALQSGRWALAADEEGIHLQRSHRRTKHVPWSAIKKVQTGTTAVQLGRYGARLGDGIRIEARHLMAPIFLETVRFRLPAEDMDRMIAVLRDVGGRHGIQAESFPMAGRETR